MTILTLVRHARASSGFEGLDDWARPLDSRGIEDCLAVAQVIGARLAAPDLILTSDAARTMQTCEVLAEGLAVGASRVRCLHELYLASDEAILELVEDNGRGCGHVAVVAHNPGLTDLCNRILAEPVGSLPPLAVASIELPGRGFTRIAPGSGRMLDYLTPSTVRAR